MDVRECRPRTGNGPRHGSLFGSLFAIDLGEHIFWAFLVVAFPFAFALAARQRYASVAAWARKLASAEGSEAVGVGFSRAASYVDGSTTSDKPPTSRAS